MCWPAGVVGHTWLSMRLTMTISSAAAAAAAEGRSDNKCFNSHIAWELLTTCTRSVTSTCAGGHVVVVVVDSPRYMCLGDYHTSVCVEPSRTRTQKWTSQTMTQRRRGPSVLLITRQRKHEACCRCGGRTPVFCTQSQVDFLLLAHLLCIRAADRHDMDSNQ